MKIQYRKFHTPDEIDLWYEKHQSAFPSNNDTDNNFLKSITAYSSSANVPINNALRYNTRLQNNDIFCPILHELITKLSTYHIPDNIIVYRYISSGLLKTMTLTSLSTIKKGTILQDKGFMSTTLIRESVTPYKERRKQNILLIISVPAGTKGTYVNVKPYA